VQIVEERSPPKRAARPRRIIAVPAPPASALAQIDWRTFERRVGAAFRGLGYRVTGFGTTSSGVGRDGGADLGLIKDGQRFLVQCRGWRKLEIGVTVIREFCRLLAVQGAYGGFMLTGGCFTPEAQALARLSRIRLYDGPQLEQLLELRPEFR
jgi:restriction system protein